MIVTLGILLLVGGAAVAYTFAEVENDRRGVERTLHRYDGLLGWILDSCLRSIEIEDCDNGPPEGERASSTARSRPKSD